MDAYWRSSGKASSLSIRLQPGQDRGIETRTWHAQLDESHREHRPNRSVVERIAGVDGVAAQQSHAVFGVVGRNRGGAIRSDAGRSAVDVTSCAELGRDWCARPTASRTFGETETCSRRSASATTSAMVAVR